LAEPIQTVMRVYGEKNPYEKLKVLTRGVSVDRATLDAFIDSLSCVPADVRRRMKRLTPQTYVGLAERLVDEYFLRLKRQSRKR
jgi:adenylosuccinate lyase